MRFRSVKVVNPKGLKKIPLAGGGDVFQAMNAQMAALFSAIQRSKIEDLEETTLAPSPPGPDPVDKRPGGVNATTA